MKDHQGMSAWMRRGGNGRGLWEAVTGFDTRCCGVGLGCCPVPGIMTNGRVFLSGSDRLMCETDSICPLLADSLLQTSIEIHGLSCSSHFGKIEQCEA